MCNFIFLLPTPRFLGPQPPSWEFLFDRVIWCFITEGPEFLMVLSLLGCSFVLTLIYGEGNSQRCPRKFFSLPYIILWCHFIIETNFSHAWLSESISPTSCCWFRDMKILKWPDSSFYFLSNVFFIMSPGGSIPSLGSETFKPEPNV